MFCVVELHLISVGPVCKVIQFFLYNILLPLCTNDTSEFRHMQISLVDSSFCAKVIHENVVQD